MGDHNPWPGVLPSTGRVYRGRGPWWRRMRRWAQHRREPVAAAFRFGVAVGLTVGFLMVLAFMLARSATWS